MVAQDYPDLMDPWRLTVVPVTGVPSGTALLLHGAEADLVLARDLGFVATLHGYLMTVARPDPDFASALAVLCTTVRDVLPSARLARIDPIPFAIRAAVMEDDPTNEGKRLRFRLRTALAEAPVVPLPHPSLIKAIPLAADLLTVARHAMDTVSRIPGGMAGVPYTIAIGDDRFAYALREADGIRFGIFRHGMQSLEVPGVVLRMAPGEAGIPMFVISGRGSSGVPCGGDLATHLLGTALLRMNSEVRARSIGMRRGEPCPLGSLHDEAFPGWVEDDDPAQDREGPSL